MELPPCVGAPTKGLERALEWSYARGSALVESSLDLKNWLCKVIAFDKHSSLLLNGGYYTKQS
jgi:hypothetical protein